MQLITAGARTATRDACDRQWLRFAAVLAFAAGCAPTISGTTAFAAPGGDASIEETTFSVGANLIGDATATCPSGRRVVGGGVGTTAPTVDGLMRASGPLDETGTTAATADGDTARSWYAAISNWREARTYKVFTLCSATSDATVEETTFSTGTTAGGEATAMCPAGGRVVGGGVGTTASFADNLVRFSGPVDETGTTAATADGDIARGWRAGVFNYGQGQTYKVFALCSAASDATVEETTFTLAADTVGAAAATCPDGRRALGGGIGTTSTDGGQVQVSGPLDETGSTAATVDGDTARSWYANVYNGLGATRTYKTFALCATSDDTTPPETTITGGPANGGVTTDNTPTFSFSSNEQATFQCSLDGRAFANCSSPHTTAALSEGRHTFAVRATDQARNTDSTAASRSFIVNSRPPGTTITFGPSGATDDSTPTFSFTADEPVSRFECRIDGTAFAGCTSPYTTAPLADGDHTFEVRAVDLAGSVDSTPAARTFTVASSSTPPPDPAPPAPGDSTELPADPIAPAADEAACQAAVVPRQTGSSGDDTLTGTEVTDLISGLAGDDAIAGSGGADCLSGDEGDDALRGDAGNDLLLGGVGDDRAKGQGGKDTLKGDAGKDALNGGKGKDKVKGNAGNDTIKAADDKVDRVNCGSGNKDRTTVDPMDEVARSCETVVEIDKA